MQISAVLLAAGLSLRMGEDKLMLRYRDKTFLQRAIDLIAELPVFERILVISAQRLDFARSIGMEIPSNFRIVINNKPEKGQGESVRLGIEATHEGSHLFFFPADQPLLTAIDIARYFELLENHPDRIIYPIIDDKPSSPTLFPPRFRRELLLLKGDSGGSIVRNANTEFCHLFSPENPKHFADFDRMEELNDLL